LFVYDVHPDNPIARLYAEREMLEVREGWPPPPPVTSNLTALRESEKWFVKDFEHEQLLIRKGLFREAGLPEDLAVGHSGEAPMPPACMRRYQERMRQKKLRYERTTGRKFEDFDVEEAYKILASSPGFEEFRETPIDESGAKTPLYPVPKGFPHNVKSRKSLEDRMLRFYSKMHASKGRVGRERGRKEGREAERV
jgi:hypothetical protein